MTPPSKIALTVLDRMTIKQKLIASFVFLCLMVALAGGSGLFFISRIKNNVNTLANVSSPLSEISYALSNEMVSTNIAVLDILSLNQVSEIQASEAKLAESETAFQARLTDLSSLLTQGGVQLNLEKVKESRGRFMTLSQSAIHEYKVVLEQKQQLKSLLASFTDQRQAFDKQLNDFIETSQTAIGEKEDRGRTLSMNPQTTAKAVSDLLLEMFSRELPVLYRASALQVFLIQLQDNLKQYLAETTLENLPALEKEYEALAGTITGRLRRLKSKLYTEAQTQSHAVLTQGFETLNQSVVGKNGMVEVHRQFLEAELRIKALKKELGEATQDVNLALGTVIKGSKEINSQVREATRKGVSFAMAAVIIIVLAGLAAGIAAALVIISAVTLPLTALQASVTQVERSSDYSIRAGDAKADEIGQTAKAFNSLMAALEAVIKEVSQVMGAVAKGDFSLRITSDQQGDLAVLKESINRSISLLGSTISQVGHVSENVSQSASDLSQSAVVLTENTRNQATSIEQISQSMDHISRRAKTNEGNAMEVQKISNQALNAVETGTQQMEAMIRVMQEIKSTSSEVADAIGIIHNITAQTKLLALNAAIEAMRVGEAGRGFSVVAREVKALSDRSALSAGAIEELVKASLTQVDKGVAEITQTADILKNIQTTVQQANRLVEEVSESSTEQNTNIESVNRGLAEMNRAVSNNLDIVKKTAEAYQNLSQLVSAMQAEVARFHLG